MKSDYIEHLGNHWSVDIGVDGIDVDGRNVINLKDDCVIEIKTVLQEIKTSSSHGFRLLSKKTSKPKSL